MMSAPGMPECEGRAACWGCTDTRRPRPTLSTPATPPARARRCPRQGRCGTTGPAGVAEDSVKALQLCPLPIWGGRHWGGVDSVQALGRCGQCAGTGEVWTVCRHWGGVDSVQALEVCRHWGGVGAMQARCAPCSTAPTGAQCPQAAVDSEKALQGRWSAAWIDPCSSLHQITSAADWSVCSQIGVEGAEGGGTANRLPSKSSLADATYLRSLFHWGSMLRSGGWKIAHFNVH
eukprot:366038-Chlamydomonas_euryale.AAC.6